MAPYSPGSSNADPGALNDPSLSNPGSPQLPSLSPPSMGSPGQLPNQTNQANPSLSPDAMKPDDAAIARAKVSFEIKPVAQNADKDTETAHNKHNVALTAPAMW
jgi:hypothetical protein